MSDIRYHARRWWAEATGIIAALVLIAIGHAVIAAALLVLTAVSIVSEARAGNGWSASITMPGITARWVADMRTGDRGHLTLFGTASPARWCYVCAQMSRAAVVGAGRRPEPLAPGSVVSCPTLGGDVSVTEFDDHTAVSVTGTTCAAKYRVELSRTPDGWTVNGRGPADRAQVAHATYAVALMMLADEYARNNRSLLSALWRNPAPPETPFVPNNDARSANG